MLIYNLKNYEKIISHTVKNYLQLVIIVLDLVVEGSNWRQSDYGLQEIT
jgi:hypothetical protein